MSSSRKRTLPIELLKKRLELIPNRLELDVNQWGELCEAVLPEWFAGRKIGCPATSIPGSPERVETYTQRASNNEEMFLSTDCIHVARSI